MHVILLVEVGIDSIGEEGNLGHVVFVGLLDERDKELN